MSEDQYRVEEKKKEEKDSVFLEPLPSAERPEKSVEIDGKRVPVVRFLLWDINEYHRDLIVLLLMPILVGLIDANIYTFVLMKQLPASSIYMFLLPAIAAIPIGLVVPNAGKALIGGFLVVVFYELFFLLFLASPIFVSAGADIGSIFFMGAMITLIYILFVSLASILGAIAGIIIREFL